MSDKKMDRPSENNETHSKILPEKSMPNRLRFWFTGLFFVMAAVALFFSISVWLLLQTQITKPMEELFANMQKFMQTGEKVNRLETSLAQLQNQVNAIALSQKQSNVAQTNYLLSLANYNLRYQNDVRSAYYLLGLAVNQLNAAPTPAQYAPVTAHMQAALTQLALIPQIDEEKTITILDELYVLIPTLSFNMYASHHKPDWQAAQEKLEQENKQLTWWQRGWSALQSLVIIRHHETAVNPMLAPPQEQSLKANLQILIQQIEISVMQRNAKLMQQNILYLQLQLGEYFDLDNPQGKKAKDLMSELTPVSNLADNTHVGFALQELQLAQQSLLTAQGKVNV